MASRIRSLAGIYALDWLRYRRLLQAKGSNYLDLANRHERLEYGPGGLGRHCLWQWTSELHAPAILPQLGLRLMRRALSDHPIDGLLDRADDVHGGIDVSFVIGHRGIQRSPLLMRTIETIAAQRGVSLECIVVEQDSAASLRASLPRWVQYCHAPPADPAMPYCRSSALNTGARHARGHLLILHDNDMLVPQDYAACMLRHARDGYEAINLKRFVFYLSRSHSSDVLERGADLAAAAPQSIVQNLESGGSVGMTREAFNRIGGMDESFVGWGGEDNEFWERAQVLKVWPYGYLPIVHLWHPAQPGKGRADNPALRRYRELSAVPVQERIGRLRQHGGPLSPLRKAA